MWIVELARTLFPVRPNDDTVITEFIDLTDRKRYSVAFELAPGVYPRRRCGVPHRIQREVRVRPGTSSFLREGEGHG